jgi:hypothetical protein
MDLARYSSTSIYLLWLTFDVVALAVEYLNENPISSFFFAEYYLVVL